MDGTERVRVGTADAGAEQRLEHERYRVEFEPLAGWGTPGTQRLRALLKVALRVFGLRCVRLGSGGDASNELDRE